MTSFLSFPTTVRLVHAFITSRLDSNNSLLYGLPKSSVAKLQRVQNCAIRLIACVKRHESIEKARRDLHWLPVRERIVFKILLIVFKIKNGLAPEYLKDLLINYNPARSLRSSNKCLLHAPSSREVSTISYGNRAFSVAAPHLWNQIPLSIRTADTVNSFKRLLKTYLFYNPIID